MSFVGRKVKVLETYETMFFPGIGAGKKSLDLDSLEQKFKSVQMRIEDDGFVYITMKNDKGLVFEYLQPIAGCKFITLAPSEKTADKK